VTIGLPAVAAHYAREQRQRAAGEALGNHAVVIGASIGGLLAARVLSDAYKSVTVIERDSLPSGDEGRRAVPQGYHAHGLIAGGTRALEELLPGFRDELIDDGAATVSAYSDMHFMARGHLFARAALGWTTITASRPFIEGHLRRRILALENVSVRQRCEVAELTATADRRRVTGVRIRARDDDGDEETLAADLVLAASGRSARVPAWLEELGYGRPQEDTLRIDLTYASRRYRLPPGALGDKVILRGMPIGVPRGMALVAQENGLWLLTLAGYGSDRPPAEEDGFLDFLQTVAEPHMLAAVRAGEPVDEIVSYRFPANLRRRYERMRRFPEGLLVIGDSICSFNPQYGQGMTVAALEAAALQRALRRGTGGLRRRYLRATTKIVDHAWQMAITSDLAQPQVEGRRPFSWRLTNAYTERLVQAAAVDGEVTAAFARVSGMLERPPKLFSPAIARRVLGKRRPGPPPWPGRPLRTPVRRRTIGVDGVATPLREAGPSDACDAVVFVHGAPGSGADFEPLLAAAGQLGRAIAWDAPGFGRSEKPAGFDHTVSGHARFLGRTLETLGVERAHLVLHGFAGLWGLQWAASEPERLASVTLICSGVPLDYRWHPLARIWRMRRAGELLMRTLNRAAFGAGVRHGSHGRLPGALVDRMFNDLDRDTRDAILRLYQSVDDVAGAARQLAEALRSLRSPALVIWGRHDPYLPAALADRQREAFPGAQVHVLDGSGHWPFIDQADRVEQLLVGFLQQTGPGAPASVLAEEVHAYGAR
jgi:pimeloyl-ACP methyl ester carboxylesterase/2-polyprenyl-6-methoxyphenol hydroxylase-like FAD-dependent oxidoreductase